MQIERDIITELQSWKGAANRKPLLLTGARQIGKTWTLMQFGKTHFEYCAKFDFDRNPEVQEAFKVSKDPQRIIKELALYADCPLVAGKTLIILDEIQACEEALNSLKYFCEEAPQFHIVAAGSLLGVAVRKKSMTVPVGKVKMVKLYPLTFREFLRAADSKVYNYISDIQEVEHLPEIIFNKLKLEYKRYQICGGMPEATVAMLSGNVVSEVDDILQDILDLYELDFSKYAEPLQVTRIRAIWHSLPSQLSKENRKFIYKVIRTGARAKEYEDALLWLKDAGLIYQVFNVSKPGIPLSAYAEVNSFKIYASDCGLLRRLSRVSADTIMNKTAGFSEFKGALAENAILQSLVKQLDNDIPYYWSSENRAEIEFVIPYRNEVVPIEVKAEDNIAGKSLSVYAQKFNPEHKIRFSMNNLQLNGGLLSCPNPLADWSLQWI